MNRGKITAFVRGSFAFCALLLLGASQPTPWEIDFQPAATEVMEDTALFHDFVMIIVTAITAFVFLLLLYCIFRFNERANPEPSRVSHNMSLEIIWTALPILILALIAVPSFRLMSKQETIPKADIVIKAIGHQWYWEYEYVDDKISFSSVMIEDDEIDKKKGQVRLLSVDNPLVLPVGKTVRIIAAASDVIHSFAVPAFGVKKDAVPGRLNETWFRVKRQGTYYGQCSELCGTRHAFMPIEVRIVSAKEYARWLRSAKKKFARYQDGEPKNTAEQGSKIKGGDYVAR